MDRGFGPLPTEYRMNFQEQIQQIQPKTAIDVGAVGVAAASWLEYLPAIAAVLSIVWLSIQIGVWTYNQIKKRMKTNG